MKFVLYDGAESYDLGGTETPLETLTAADIILITECMQQSFPATDEAAIEREEERLSKEGRSVLVGYTETDAVVFSIDSAQHDSIREKTKAQIVDASYVTALAGDMQPDEIFLFAYKFGDFLYISLWAQSVPRFQNLVLFRSSEDLNAKLDICIQQIQQFGNTSAVRIVSNLEEEKFATAIADIKKIIHSDDLEIEHDHLDLKELSKNMLSQSEESEYMTEHELAAKISKKNRKQQLIVIAIVLAISIPGFAFAGYKHWVYTNIADQNKSAEASINRLSSDIESMQAQKGATLYYNRSGQALSIALQMFEYGFNEGTVKNKKTNITYSGINNKDATVDLQAIPGSTVVPARSFIRADEILYRHAGSVKR